ncbi:MAG: FMN-binding protein [Lapillicoccus sp.]
MRRIAGWLLATVTVLVLVFSYHTSTSSRFAATAQVAASRERAVRPATLASGTVDGDVVTTRFGQVQVRVVVTDGRIASVEALQFPNRDRHDQMINARALPILGAEVVAAQSAAVDAVSGATLTSQGYLQSLQSAIDRAHR